MQQQNRQMKSEFFTHAILQQQSDLFGWDERQQPLKHGAEECLNESNATGDSRAEQEKC